MGPKLAWKWPKQKDKLAPYREMCRTFRAVFLKGLQRLMLKEEIVHHETYEELTKDLEKKRWVVNNRYPTAETKVIEEYLSRYICRIGITNNRLTYDADGKNVQIEYNDYSNQIEGQAAPKEYLNVPPLVAMSLILQHQLPAYFQKARHYGLHHGGTYKKIKDRLPEEVKRNGLTVRTMIQILKHLLKQEPYHCKQCGGCDFEERPIAVDLSYLDRFLIMPNKGPPILGKAAVTY